MEAHQIGALAGDEEDADRRGVAHHHRARDELRHLAEVEQAGQELRDADQKRHVGRQRQRVQAEIGVARDRRRHDQADRRRRTKHVIVRGKEQRAEETADHHRDDHRHRRQS